MISLKSAGELAKMRAAGRIVAQVLKCLGAALENGISTNELDKLAKDLIEKSGAKAAFFGYKGYPKNICISINEAGVHGIPSKRRVRNGDIVSVDVGVEVDGYFADGAATFGVGNIPPHAKKLMQVTREALRLGIEKALTDNRLSDISFAIQRHVEGEGFSVVKAFVGHGIGSSIHEDPPIPNYGPPNQGVKLKPGMTLAIEPMVNCGTSDVRILDDGWTAITADKSLSAHFEHTIAITENEPEILTKW